MVSLPREVIEIEDDETDYGKLSEEIFTLDDAGEGFVPISPVDRDRDQALLLDWTAPDFISSPFEATDPAALYQICYDQILRVFPDICLDHVRELFNARIEAGQKQLILTANDFSQAIITQILDDGKYPKEKDKKKDLKRKRSTEPDSNDNDIKWTSQDRSAQNFHYIEAIRSILRQEFINIPQRFIDLQVKEKKFLYPAYLALELAERTYNETSTPPFHKLKTMRKFKGHPKPGLGVVPPTDPDIENELSAVKENLRKQEAHRRKTQEAIDADLAVDKDCQERGDMIECQCCFTDTPIPKSTHCNGENAHFFCFDCARSYAKSQTELSRYKLSCMDGSGCKEVFTRTQIHRFLDKRMIDLLERLQQQDDLRAANLPNLETCPFCDYAAICEPIEINREFHCYMPNCERVSCRLCKQDTHLPKTCEEHRKENGLTERHALEEAMTKALIRECPKCRVPIIKDGGCNKLTCSKCHSYVCDYCGKDITKIGYAHFQPEGSGRGASGCPASDNTERRNASRIEEAEKSALTKIRAQNPTLSEDDLKIKFSEKVQAQKRPTITHNPYQAPFPYMAGAGLYPPHPMNPWELNHPALPPQPHQQHQDEIVERLAEMRQVYRQQHFPHHHRRKERRNENNQHRLDQDLTRGQQRLQELERGIQERQQRHEEIRQRNTHFDHLPHVMPGANPARHRLGDFIDREIAHFRTTIPHHGIIQGLAPLMNPFFYQPHDVTLNPHPPDFVTRHGGDHYIPDMAPMPNANAGLGFHDLLSQYGGVPDTR